MSVAAVALLLAMASSAPLPALLGTDTLPPPSAVAAVPTSRLLEVVQDPAQALVHRARAARLLGGRDVHDAALDGALRRGRATAPSLLAAQLTLALADRALGRGDRAAAEKLADDAVDSADVDVARAGVLIWWRVGGEVGRGRLRGVAASHADERVRGAARGRLRWWSASGSAASATAGSPKAGSGDDGGATMLQPPHGGPPPAR